MSVKTANPKADTLAAARRELEAQHAAAQSARLTGSVTVTVHYHEGTPNGAGSTVTKGQLK